MAERVSYTVETHDGKRVVFDAPAGASKAQIETLAARALKQKVPDATYKRPVLEQKSNEDYWRAKLGDQGEISTYDPTLRDRVADIGTNVLRPFSVDEYHAQRLGDRAASVLDWSPLGNAMGLQEGASDVSRGLRSGDAATAGLGALSFALSLAPGGAGTRRPVENVLSALLKDKSGTFGGVRAKTADLAALSRAEKMLMAGDSKNTIWNETGWFQGADKKWRFEIPDDAMTYKPYVLEDAGSAGLPMKDAISHPPLESAYNTGAVRLYSDTADNGLRGSWADELGRLTLDTDFTPESIRSTAAHELQHFIQGREGFARGGMPGSIRHDAMSEIGTVNARLSELAQRMDVVRGAELANLRQEYEALMEHKLTNLVPKAQLDPYEAYRRLAGEVEARNVQRRLAMDPAMRRATPPWATQDFPDEDQIVLFGR